MPQPLRNLPAVNIIAIGSNTDSPSKTRPALALAAMNIVAEWSILEGFINGVFVELLGTNATQAAAIFASIRSPAGQRDAFKAVASVSLPDEESRDLLLAVLTVCEKASGTRNRIAHWIWGHSPQLPDSVLLADPVAVASWRAALKDYQAAQPNRTLPLPHLNREKVYAYKQEDFDAASDVIQRSIILASLLRFHIGGVVYPEQTPLRDEPEIRPILDRIARDRQTGE